ncbi:MAG TPA: CAP domain-containing protein [Acidimicrobiales bacterium]|nr:CAP domain-containing protein [Acidimicrobiales bacterium]
MRVRRSTVWKLAGIVAVATVAVGIAPAGADAGDAARLLSLTNQVRSSRSLGSLTVDAELSAVAQRWAATLAAQGVLSHNAALPSQVTGWKSLGENVGVGGTVDAIHNGFLASPTHLENLVDPAFTRVGFGIVRPDARIFVVEVFMKPAPTPAAAATATTTTAPRPTATPVTPGDARAELSPWMVLSLEGLRSMTPGAPAKR